jgi:hypothetical protein
VGLVKKGLRVVGSKKKKEAEREDEGRRVKVETDEGLFF